MTTETRKLEEREIRWATREQFPSFDRLQATLMVARTNTILVLGIGDDDAVQSYMSDLIDGYGSVEEAKAWVKKTIKQYRLWSSKVGAVVDGQVVRIEEVRDRFDWASA